MNSPLAPRSVGTGPVPDVSADSLAGHESTLNSARTGQAPEDELRQRWQRGDRMPAEAFFQRDPALAQNEEAALDLIYCEFLLRGERGETPTVGEYLTRFPQFAERLQFLLSFDEVVC